MIDSGEYFKLMQQHADLPVGKKCVVKLTTSASGFGTIERTEQKAFVIKPLKEGEMPFLLQGGFGNARK